MYNRLIKGKISTSYILRESQVWFKTFSQGKGWGKFFMMEELATFAPPEMVAMVLNPHWIEPTFLKLDSW